MGRHYKHRNKFISCLIPEFNRIYAEMSDYNSNYWSKYLGAFWMIIGTILALMTYLVTLANVKDTTSRCLLYTYQIAYTSSLMFVIHTSNGIYMAARSSHKLLNSYFCDNYPMPIGLRIKVCLIFFVCIPGLFINSYISIKVVKSNGAYS